MTKAVNDVMAEKKNREFVATGIKLRADLAKGLRDTRLKLGPIRRSSSRRHWRNTWMKQHLLTSKTAEKKTPCTKSTKPRYGVFYEIFSKCMVGIR